MIAVLIVVAVLCVLAYVFATQLSNWGGNQLRDSVSVPARANHAIAPLGKGMAYYDGATLHALDSHGRQIWSYAAGSSAGFSVDEGGVACWSGSMLSLIDAEKGSVPYSGHLENPVISARYSTGYTAAQVAALEGGVVQEHNSTMLLLDSGGRNVERIELPNQTVLDFGFFYNGANTLFWVMSLDTEGTVPVTTIKVYRPGKMVLAGTISDPMQVLYEVAFQPSKIRTVGETYIKDFDYTNKEITANRILVYGWYMIAKDGGAANPSMVFVPSSQADGSAGISDIRIIRGQSDNSIRLPSEAKQVFSSGDSVYAFANDRVMVTSGGSLEPVSYALPVYIDRVIGLTEGHSAIVTAGNAVYMIPLS